MSEVASNTPRLMAAAKEFNIGKDTLIEVLLAKGFNADDLKQQQSLRNLCIVCFRQSSNRIKLQNKKHNR